MDQTLHRDELPDTRPMIVVHNAFRREFGLAGGLVRRVGVGDRARAELVARHLELVLRGLHHHHELEDELLWPPLHERVPEELEPIVQLMEAQHAGLARLLERLDLLLPKWVSGAATEDRDELAHVLDDLYAGLTEHLEAEERRLLPIAARHITRAEWEEIGRRAEAANRRRDRSLAFGMLQYEGDPEVLASMLRSAPLPARLLVPHLARRAFRRHSLAIHGTATP